MVNITFVWDASADPDVIGYRLYRGFSSGAYIIGDDPPFAEIPAGTHQVTVATEGDKCFFILTAYDTNGNESMPSNELILLGRPTGFRIGRIENV